MVQDQKSRIDAQRILTEEDFEKIKKLKAKVCMAPGRWWHEVVMEW